MLYNNSNDWIYINNFFKDMRILYYNLQSV
jgi:hypothetical protein